jgi:hypothetical protein
MQNAQGGKRRKTEHISVKNGQTQKNVDPFFLYQMGWI